MSIALKAHRRAQGGSDSLRAGLWWTLVDESPVISVRFELENDPDGLWWTIIPRHGIQKVRGSNPLGSTKFRIRNRALSLVVVAHATG